MKSRSTQEARPAPAADIRPRPRIIAALHVLTQAATEQFNDLEYEFDEAGSEIETVAREWIGEVKPARGRASQGLRLRPGPHERRPAGVPSPGRWCADGTSAPARNHRARSPHNAGPPP
ncbi:DUF5713 family protein, partial [Actinomadura adrarensis]